MIKAEIVRIAKIKCPRCGSEFPVNISTNVLEEAKVNPLGLAGVAVPHSDHVLVAYFDRNGDERGVRVFSILQAPEKGVFEVNIPEGDVKGLRNIAGFIIESRKLNLRLKYSARTTSTAIKVSALDTTLEVDFQRDISYHHVKAWLELLVDVFENSYSTLPADYVNAVRVFDIMVEEKPFTYAKQIFWLIANASTITIRPRLPESLLIKKYRPTILYEKYNGGFVSRAVDSVGLRVSEVLGTEMPQILYSYAETLLSLYRRGVIDLVIE